MNATGAVHEDFSEYRPATDKELNFIKYLLSLDGEALSCFLPQTEAMEVKSSCKCGCPSLDLHSLRSVAPVPTQPRILAEFTGRVDGKLVGGMLWNVGGFIRELEVYELEGLDRSFGLPATKL